MGRSDAGAVSVASGFFDGQLARGDLAPAEVGFQVLLLGLTGVLGGVATVVVLAGSQPDQPTAVPD